eukprot:97024_1
MESHAELLKLHQILADDEEKETQQKHVGDADNTQLNEKGKKDEKEEEKHDMFQELNVDDLLQSDNKHEDENEIFEEEQHNGIEFDAEELPPIFVMNGKGTISLLGDEIQCKSRNSNLTTFKSVINAPTSGKYYFEVNVKTNGKVGIGLIDDEYHQKTTTHGWFIYADDQVSKTKKILNVQRDDNEEKQDTIIGVAVDLSNKKCEYYFNAQLITTSFDEHDIPYIDQQLYHAFLLESTQNI